MTEYDHTQGGPGEFSLQQPLTPLERAQQLVDRYPEMTWMVDSNTHATPESSVAASGSTVGASLFPAAEKATLSEFDRAYVGIAAMDWVRAGDYESLTACQPEAAKLSREGFDWLRSHTEQVLPDAESVQAMETFIAINDLGKIGPIVDTVKQMPGAPDTVDHDVIMHFGLQYNRSLSPSYAKLSQRYQENILQGMATKFNLGQLMQAEGVAASLSGLAQASKESREFYLLHTLYDIGGAAGQAVQNGSIILTESTVKNYKYALEALDGLDEGKTVDEAYHQFLGKKAKEFGIDMVEPDDVAVTRLATMLRMSTAEQAAKVRTVYDALPENTRAILGKELGKAGTEDGIASLIYYSPALLANLQKNAGPNAEKWQAAMTTGFTTLARVYQTGRTRESIRKSNDNGIQTILISELAQAASSNPERLSTSNIILTGNGLDVTAELQPVVNIELTDFPRLQSLAELPGERFAIVGMGGGSDGVQAAIFARLLEDAGKSAPVVISIRSAKPQSQGADGTVADNRTVQNHGGELADGVFKITPDTRGAGRFLEHLPAVEVPMYLVTENGTDLVADKLQTVFDSVGGVDTVIGLDTGGDVLYPVTAGHDTATTTPDQDVRSLNAIQALDGVAKYCMVVAPGIDSPPNAGEILAENHAVYFEPNAGQAADILSAYRRWQMDGNNESYYGKTPLAWQAALRTDSSRGVVTVNLPRSVVTNDKNPWNPYVVSQPAMRGAFIMDLSKTQL